MQPQIICNPQSLRYQCERYRIELCLEQNGIYVRELFKAEGSAQPIVDAASGCRLTLIADGQPVGCRCMSVKNDDRTLTAHLETTHGRFHFYADEVGFRLTSDGSFTMHFAFGTPEDGAPTYRTSGEILIFSHGQQEYSIYVMAGGVTKRDGRLILHSVNDRISVKLF